MAGPQVLGFTGLRGGGDGALFGFLFAEQGGFCLEKQDKICLLPQCGNPYPAANGISCSA